MRRYGTSSQQIVIPGQSAGLQLTLQPTIEAATPCQAKPTELFWFSDLTGEFSEVSEAAYLLPEGAAGPVLGVAALLGEVCDESVDWGWEWFPAEGERGEPGIASDGARLVVYPLADTQPGVLLVSARAAGRSFGPILLSVLRYVCGYGYGYDYGGSTASGWFDLSEVFTVSDPLDRELAYLDLASGASSTHPLSLKPGVTLPNPVQMRVSIMPNHSNSGTFSLSVTVDGQAVAFSSGSYPLATLTLTGAPQQIDLQSATGFSGFLLLQVRRG